MADRTDASAELEQTTRRAFELLDAMDIDRMGEMLAADVRGIDEISRTWMRGREAVQTYLKQLAGTVSDVSSRVVDFDAVTWGDVGLVTFVLDQSFTAEGSRQSASAPTSVVYRREDGQWKIGLFHSVPLPEPV